MRNYFYVSSDDREEYDAYVKEARKGERAMLLLMGRFREAMDENYRDNRLWRKYFANHPLWNESYKSDESDEADEGQG